MLLHVKHSILRFLPTFAIFAALLTLLPLPTVAQAGPRILIVADMEGLTGAVTSDQLGPEGFEYERFRRIMTDEVLAAMAGHYNVPVLMLSGDDAIAEEARRFLPEIEVAIVKRALSFHSADPLRDPGV